MCHGDDFGLVVPPALSRRSRRSSWWSRTPTVKSPAPPRHWSTNSTRRGVRARLDDNVDQGFGWRATEWDLQGVPIRVEIGPRDIAEQRRRPLPARHPRQDQGGAGRRRRRCAAADASTCRPTCSTRRRHDAMRSSRDCTTLDAGARRRADRCRPRAVGVGRRLRRRAPRRGAASRCGACSATTERCPTPTTTRARSPMSPGPTDSTAAQRLAAFRRRRARASPFGSAFRSATSVSGRSVASTHRVGTL